MGDKKPSTSAIVIMAGGGVTLLFGLLLDFWTYTGGGEKIFGSLAFPLATLIWLLGSLVGVAVALETFAGTKLPDQVLDFSLNQALLVLATWPALMLVGMLVWSDSPDKGGGFTLMLLGTIAEVVGCVLRDREAPSPASGTAPPTTF